MAQDKLVKPKQPNLDDLRDYHTKDRQLLNIIDFSTVGELLDHLKKFPRDSQLDTRISYDCGSETHINVIDQAAYDKDAKYLRAKYEKELAAYNEEYKRRRKEKLLKELEELA